jgi:hypothetical protein
MEQLALFEIPWTIPSFAEALVILTSPPGCPNRAKAAGATKIGRDDGKDNSVVAALAWDILFSLHPS